MSQISVLGSAERAGWTPLVDPPGRVPSPGREVQAFASGDGTFTCGLWEREPDTWSFERPYDEVAYVIRGSAEIETDDGRALLVSACDVLVTPIGSKGAWHILEPLVKFYAIHTGGTVGDTTVRTIGADDPVEWVVLANPPGDQNPAGREWYTHGAAPTRGAPPVFGNGNPRAGRSDASTTRSHASSRGTSRSRRRTAPSCEPEWATCSSRPKDRRACGGR
jgi:uncharacterized cupin superfamily protein